MRIANNIMALNTHRSYTQNNESVSASAEKLSSGYRINKAGDDAAGLAISEKMRSQIRGLNMATKNSQDAVSLIQTAEGALQEVHSMLQRMNELAVQSATGTNETFDRTQIAKEFEQLKREINDISVQTTFNNMNILDGSLSAEGVNANRTAYTSGVYAQFEEKTPTVEAGGLQNISLTEGTAYSKGYSAKFSIDLAGVKLSTDTAAADTFKITVGGGDVQVTLGAQSASTFKDTDIANLFSASSATLSIGGETAKFTISVSGTKLNFTIVDTAADGSAYKNMSKEKVEALSASFTGTKVTITDDNKKITDAAAGKANVDATQAKSSFNFDIETVKKGDTFTIGKKEFTFYDSKYNADHGITDPTGAFAINIQQVRDADALATAINTALKGGDGKTVGGAGTTDAEKAGAVYATASGSSVQLSYVGNAGTTKTSNAGSNIYGVNGTDYVQISSKPVKPENAGLTTFELDTSKMKAGDTISYKNDAGKTVNHTYVVGETAADIAKAFGIKTKDASNPLGVDGNTWSVEGKDSQADRISFKAADDFKQYDTMKIQVGALEGEQLSIKITAMNTSGLKLDNEGIFDQASAGKAVTATREAINKVSDQRALLGAMQNRMSHKIANLKVSTENLSAAESRIRDVDMAAEMTNFTKNNILSQAATAMLAQANNAPQNVLSLLR